MIIRLILLTVFAWAVAGLVHANELCANGLDDDRDRRVDCADPDCSDAWVCLSKRELCANGSDDDGDGHIDCSDQDCEGYSVCTSLAENCMNGNDDDGDGDFDCADSDCKATYVCLPRAELCHTREDEDGDGDIGCADADCKFTARCQTPARWGTDIGVRRLDVPQAREGLTEELKTTPDTQRITPRTPPGSPTLIRPDLKTRPVIKTPPDPDKG